MRRQPTWSETVVGRRLPAEPRMLDVLMAGFVREDGEPAGRMDGDPFMSRVHRQARRKGWIEFGFGLSICGGRPGGIWYPTVTGLEEAKAARARVRKAREARDEWARELTAKLKERRDGVL